MREAPTPAGFTLTFAAMREGLGYGHSHMVGVVKEYQNRRVGRLLKLAQGEDALRSGRERLGAIVRGYIANLYGRTSRSLHAGLPTDRLAAKWWVRSQRVEEVLGGRVRPMAADGERIAISSGIRAICQDEPLSAEKIQTKVCKQFLANLANGRAAVRFELNEEQGTYLLERYED
jgi:predicted GNAT superfamily acetyltransferase